MTYGKEGQVYGSSINNRSIQNSKCTLTDGWICGTISTASTIYAHPASYFQPIAYTRKRQAKQPCLDTEGATESDGCSSSLRMEDIHVGPGRDLWPR